MKQMAYRTATFHKHGDIGDHHGEQSSTESMHDASYQTY